MTNASGPSGPGEPSDGAVYFVSVLIIVGFAAGVLVLVPLVCGAVVFVALRRLLARRDWIIVTAAGVLGLVLRPGENALGYGHWLAALVGHGPGDPREAPVTVILCAAAVTAGCAGLAFGRAIGSPVAGLGRFLRLKNRLFELFDGTWLRRKELVDDPITPGRVRREMLRQRASGRVPLTEIPAVRGPHATRRARRTPLETKTLPIGLGARDRPVRLSVRELGMHGAVVGSTGSGKTVTLMWIIGAALDMGFDVSVLDMKEDTEPGGLRDFLRAYSAMHDVPLQEIALGDDRPRYWFNALAGMSPDETFDTIMTMVEFDDAYWQALNRKVLQQVVQLCHQAHEVAPDRFGPPTMLEIGKIMEQGPAMGGAVRERALAIDAAAGAGHCKERYANVLRPSGDEAKSAASFGTRLTGLYDSGAGRRVLAPGEGREMIDVRRDGLTYIGLNSLGQPDMARVLSSSALQRLSVYAAQRIQGREPKDRPRLIVVDEANFIDRTIAMNMLSRVRSALFSMILCTQGPTDWIDENGDDWSRLTQNINWLIAMAQSSPESAEKCAEFLGMRDNNTFGVRVGQSGAPSHFSAMTEEQFIVAPRELRDLGTGEGYLRVNKPGSRVEYLVVPMRDLETRWYEKRVMA
ncbi:hypothetical protein BJF79_32395 [Actinomadura sp. CNU-125]|uniref:TraM recognition domain-containing protein n=1 Tax=Actinomadura sp. CNU-125 TaxID=1904961 RepID=UPI000968D126|nr:TraM recognition domain-containing protein [Actinomadura sp. CNU-125]OLT35460.1 hypothetical protein BJF79_32395 [Actinomadura sp. CNU-125]